METVLDLAFRAAKAAAPPPRDASTRAQARRRARELLARHDAVLVAHYYVDGELQDLALETGGCVADSLEMARFGRDHPGRTLVVAGVRFMGETAKILSPEKRVLMPDLQATCSLDIGCPPEQFARFCDEHPDRTVVVYANTSAAVKARADWMVTSSCALAIVADLKARGEKVLWAPDRHLGRYIQQQTGADMLLWDATCVVHDEFKGIELELMRKQHPRAKVLVHPESPESVIRLADLVGSTTQLLRAVTEMDADEFIVATDAGLFHRMHQMAPGKTLLEAPTAGASATCKSCAHCPWMAMNSVEGLVQCLSGNAQAIQAYAIELDPGVIRDARTCIERMLDFVARNPGATALPAGGFVPNLGAA
jgi:quinolinate synthase